MAAVTHPFVLLGIVSTAAAVGIAAVAWYQRESPGAREYIEHGYSTATDGTGLGMSIVRTTVKARGWEIAVDESDDGGARFERTNFDREAIASTEATRPRAE